MIDYVEQFLGLSSGDLHTPFGVMLCFVLLCTFVYCMVKIILYWFETIFGRH